MFQTITPFAVKYNLTINSAYEEGDYKHISKALLKEKGTVIIVWAARLASFFKLAAAAAGKGISPE